jgi:membrane-bound metal-dependent hydrolase YbcI (DUF457 family)
LKVPTPVGHAVAGLAVGWVVERLSGDRPGQSPEDGDSRWWRRALPLVCAVVAFVPDLDIVLGAHRGASHSAAGVIAAGLAGAAIAVVRRWPIARTSIACALALASHVVLDWLGRDSSIPIGIPALWPFSTHYFYSGLDVFWDVSRRYWIPREFILGNLEALARELVVLGPMAALAFWFRFGDARLKPR